MVIRGHSTRTPIIILLECNEWAFDKLQILIFILQVSTWGTLCQRLDHRLLIRNFYYRPLEYDGNEYYEVLPIWVIRLVIYYLLLIYSHFLSCSLYFSLLLSPKAHYCQETYDRPLSYYQGLDWPSAPVAICPLARTPLLCASALSWLYTGTFQMNGGHWFQFKCHSLESPNGHDL